MTKSMIYNYDTNNDLLFDLILEWNVYCKFNPELKNYHIVCIGNPERKGAVLIRQENGYTVTIPVTNGDLIDMSIEDLAAWCYFEVRKGCGSDAIRDRLVEGQFGSDWETKKWRMGVSDMDELKGRIDSICGFERFMQAGKNAICGVFDPDEAFTTFDTSMKKDSFLYTGDNLNDVLVFLKHRVRKFKSGVVYSLDPNGTKTLCFNAVGSERIYILHIGGFVFINSENEMKIDNSLSVKRHVYDTSKS